MTPAPLRAATVCECVSDRTVNARGATLITVVISSTVEISVVDDVYVEPISPNTPK
jgi:hypothetical protein